MDVVDRLNTALSDRYRIEREIGSGGMATVYLALDLKHDRKVAVKVLRPELAAVLGAERFLSEIKVTANLQHPHILPLHDSGEADGMLFYVMPYVEGESLRRRLDRERQLPVEEAVRIASEVASALDYAHRHGVIHRDIKPGNILLLDGQALVVDFGIALAVTAAGGNRVTETGLSLGTPEYMSPEQAAADRDLDSRSDVYSLGAVLYEMLVGEPPHTGPSVQSVLSRVLTREPESIANRRRSVPVQVDRAVRVALEKVAADRFQTAQAFAQALSGDVVFPPTSVPSSAAFGPSTAGQAKRRNLWGIIPVAVASTFVVGGIGGWFLARALSQTEPPASVTSFTVPIPGGIYLGQQPELALSPDGETLVFRAGGLLHARPLSEFESRPIPGTEGAYNPFFSPDGQFLGFVQDGALRRVPLAGGPVAEITVLPDGWLQGADWGSNGTIVFSGVGGVRRVPAGGGPLEVITTVDSTSEHMHMWPQLLAHDRVLLYTAMGPSAQWEDAKVVMLDLESGERKVVAERATFGRYIPTGHILYATVSGTLLALPFDLDSFEVRGDAVPMESGVHVAAWGGGAQFAVSRGGTAAFIRGSVWEDHLLQVVDRSGESHQIGAPLRVYYLRISPDGARAALTVSRPGETDIHLLDLSSGALEHLTFGDSFDDTAVWSPDGTRIAFSADWVNGASRVFVQDVNPGAPPVTLFTGDYHIHIQDWSPDGRWICFYYIIPELQQDVYVVDVNRPDTLLPIVSTPARETTAQFSPDGTWLAYVQNGDIYAVPFPPTGGIQQISSGGGASPRWTDESSELVFWKGDTMMVTKVSTEGPFRRETPHALFTIPDRVSGYYDVTPDGQRFVIATRNPDALATEIHVVRNWTQALRGPGES